MLIQIIFFILSGIIFGTLTGLIPGIHINLLAIFLIYLSSSYFINPLYSLIFLMSLSITHTFVDFIPSIFLGCPDSDTELSILPGHKLLKNKRGYEAVHLSNLGGLISLGIILLLIFPSIILIPKIYIAIERIIPYLLLTIIFLTIFHEKKKISSLKVILLTGFFGLIINYSNCSQPLLPLLGGLFGTSNIILSIKNKTKLPQQIITKSKINLIRPTLASIISAPICSFLPAVGSGQSAILGNLLIKQSSKQFLILIGIINTLVMSYSLITLYLINKTRTGTMVVIKELIQNLDKKYFILLVFIVLISGVLAYFVTEYLTKKIAKNFNKINYTKLSYFTLFFIFLITVLISGVVGLIILILSTLIGIYCIKQKVRRTHMMNALTIPTIFWLI